MVVAGFLEAEGETKRNQKPVESNKTRGKLRATLSLGGFAVFTAQ
jgi:hypothetical protein